MNRPELEMALEAARTEVDVRLDVLCPLPARQAGRRYENRLLVDQAIDTLVELGRDGWTLDAPSDAEVVAALGQIEDAIKPLPDHALSCCCPTCEARRALEKSYAVITDLDRS